MTTVYMQVTDNRCGTGKEELEHSTILRFFGLLI